VPTALPDMPALDCGIEAALRARLDAKTKPRGSLGRLEDLAVQLGRIQGSEAPRAERPAVVVFAADHGVAGQGVSAFPAAVTAQMVRNFLAGGAAISVLARSLDLVLEVVDAGVDADLSGLDGLTHRKVARGTRDFVAEPAMSVAERDGAIAAGIEIAAAHADAGTRVIGFGDMGIGNTSSAALLMSLLLGRPVSQCVGAGTGLDAAGLDRKRRVLERAHRRVHAALAGHDPASADGALAVLAECGGLEIAMMAGAMLGAAARRVAVIVDGFIASAALLAAWRARPAVLDFCIFAHRSGERGHGALLEAVGARPLLDLDMRLGEGTAAALAVPIVRAALDLLERMASFEQAGVSGRSDA